MLTRYRVLDAPPLPEHVSVKPGDLVYRLRSYDYGLASDDTAATGVEHISVTLNPHGGYPSFTIPVTALGDPESVQPVYPSDDHTKDVCKIGHGAKTCRYLTMGGGGWSCEKFSAMSHSFDLKVERGLMHAAGDNCDGLDFR